jgi:hypothetical protein
VIINPVTGATLGGYCGVGGFILSGVNGTQDLNNPITIDGTMATIPLTVASTIAAGTVQIGLASIQAVDINGNQVAMNPQWPPQTISVTIGASANLCDVNQDGTVNYLDALVLTQAIAAMDAAAAQSSPPSVTCPLHQGAKCTLTNLIYVIEAIGGQSCKIVAGQ